ncbi:MAG: helix-turn-helix domain-containing protein [Gammaproteobacteria bacterium]
MCPQQEGFQSFAAAPGSTVYVSDRVSYRTEGTERVISVHGIVFAHYQVGDRAAETYAMITLCESGYASQTEIARAFGYSTRSMRRYQERFEAGGIAALARAAGRPTDAPISNRKERGRDRMILHLKMAGMSNRAIAGRLGVSEMAIRKRLRRLGWHPKPPSCLPFGRQTTAVVVEVNESTEEMSSRAPTDTPTRPISGEEDGTNELPSTGLDPDPLDRSTDQALAALGLLEDATPLFAPAQNLPMAGVLLAIPALVASGVLPIARTLYGSIAPAFYGLRTTLVAYILLALLRIPRPENLKEHVPGELGRIIGLDRILEVKTLRRKLTRLASRKMGPNFGRELAQRRVAERGHMMGFLYIDGHVRAYHGTRRIAKGYDTRIRLAVPATTDYWVNDRSGDPLFVVTAEANAALTRMLEPILQEVRTLLGPGRRATVVFDRGGWSPKVFVKLLAMGFDILTYRKGRVRRVAEKRFVLRTARLDGRSVKYRLFDQPIRLLKGKLRLRQVTRLSEDGHQTSVLTSRWDLCDIHVAYRMFERWRQENFFKYLREEYLIDGLVDYQVEPDDPQRSVPNPARKTVDKALRKARAEVRKVQEIYGATALEHSQSGTATLGALTAEEKKIQHELKEANDQVQTLRAQQKALPTRIPLSQVRPDEEPVKLSTERKHLTNVLKLVAYQIESDLVNLIRPHYARTDDEGRTLIQTALQCAATLEPSATELHITLCPLSSAHRSQAVAALCETLNRSGTRFPGTRLRMHFAVTGASK